MVKTAVNIWAEWKDKKLLNLVQLAGKPANGAKRTYPTLSFVRLTSREGVAVAKARGAEFAIKGLLDYIPLLLNSR